MILIVRPYNKQMLITFVVNKKNMSKKPGFLYLFTMGMTIIYVAIGIFLLFSSSASELLPGWRHLALGLIMFIYAGYRIFRLKRIQQQIEKEQSTN